MKIKNYILIPFLLLCLDMQAQEFEPELSLFKRISQKVADTSTFTAGFNLQWNDFDNIDGVVTEVAFRAQPFNSTPLKRLEAGFNMKSYWHKSLFINSKKDVALDGHIIKFPINYLLIDKKAKLEIAVAPRLSKINQYNEFINNMLDINVALKFSYGSFLLYAERAGADRVWRNLKAEWPRWDFNEDNRLVYMPNEYWTLYKLPESFNITTKLDLKLDEKLILLPYVHTRLIPQYLTDIYYLSLGTSIQTEKWTFNPEIALHKLFEMKPEVGLLIKRRVKNYTFFISGQRINYSFTDNPRFQTNLGIEYKY